MNKKPIYLIVVCTLIVSVLRIKSWLERSSKIKGWR